MRDTDDVNYVVDNLTNRYDSVGDSNLIYDEAGNLKVDRQGYGYEYDYENRIVEINDVNGTAVAEFTYDCLGRRIEKKDLIDANNTRRYYYNNNWQVLSEYDGGGGGKNYLIYGNYIDEVLFSATPYPFLLPRHYYVHDHLYSPAALTDTSAVVIERYEYDAYGNCHVLEPNFADDPDGQSDYENPYLFTGRRVDILDNGSLKIQYNRNRYYDYYTGRWLTHDPLGISPGGRWQDRLSVFDQYRQGLSLYEYVGGHPTMIQDSFGLCPLVEGKPWLERVYFKRYMWRSRLGWWDPFYSYHHSYISWQYLAVKSLSIGIIGPGPGGKWDAGTIATLYYYSWEWPAEWYWSADEVKKLDKQIRYCRIWVICKAKCCGQMGPVSWKPKVTVKKSFLGLTWLVEERAHVFGRLRKNSSIWLHGPPVRCEPFGTWNDWEKALCKKEDHKKNCGCDSCK